MPRAFLQTAFWYLENTLILYVVLSNAIYFFLMIVGYFVLRRGEAKLSKNDVESLLKSSLVPGVSVLAPAYNQELAVRESVRSMLRLRHPLHEVIVVNDGSKDRTLEFLIEEFRLYKSSRMPWGSLKTNSIRGVYESRDPIRLVVIDKENGGKADSLNAGLNYCRLPLFAVVDSDSLLERDALIGIIRPFLDDPATVASGGIVRAVNGCGVRHAEVTEVRAPRGMLARLQVVEYLRAFLGGRMALSCFNSLLVISGAFGMFRRDAVEASGGFATDTVGEDMELVLRLHHEGCIKGKRPKIVFVPEPVCWTEVPETLRVLRRQRNRWQRGAVESIFRNRRLMFRRGSGILGWFAFPYFVVFELFGSIVELLGYVSTAAGLFAGLIAPALAWQFFIVSALFGMALSLGAVLLEEMTSRKYPAVEDLVKLLIAVFIESFGYRQLTAFWRLEGLLDSFRGKKSWRQMERRGFVQS